MCFRLVDETETVVHFGSEVGNSDVCYPWVRGSSNTICLIEKTYMPSLDLLAAGKEDEPYSHLYFGMTDIRAYAVQHKVVMECVNGHQWST